MMIRQRLYYVPLLGKPIQGQVAFIDYTRAVEFASSLGHHLIDYEWGQRVQAWLIDPKNEE